MTGHMANIMTREELNSKWPILRAICIEHGLGWYEIIDRIMAAILEAGFDPERDEIQQIKEKFGTLRVYVSCDARQDASDESQNFQTGDRFERILSAIKANDTSGKTCEECGKPGRLLVSAGWWSTRCPEHANADALPPAEYFAKKQTVRGRSDDGT